MSSAPERDTIADLPWPEPKAPRAEITCAIREHCTRDLCPKRRMSAANRVGISLLISAFVIGVILLLTRHHQRPPGALRTAVFGVIGWLLVQGLVLVVGLAAPPGRRLGRPARIALAVIVPLVFFGYLSSVSAYSLPVGEFVSNAHSAGHAVGCGFVTFLFGAAAAGCMLMIWRRTDPLTPRLSGAFTGLVGGLTGAVAAGCGCPSQEGLHLLFSHGFVVVALVLLGGLAGRRWLSP